MNGRRSVRRSPSNPVFQDNQNDHDDTREPTGSGVLQSNRWYLRNSVGNSSTVSTTSSSPTSSSTEEGQENGDLLIRGPLMFTREIIERESSSTTMSSNLSTNECAQTNVLSMKDMQHSLPHSSDYSLSPRIPLKGLRLCKRPDHYGECHKFLTSNCDNLCCSLLLMCMQEIVGCTFIRGTRTAVSNGAEITVSHFLLEEQTRYIESLKLKMDLLHDQISGFNKSLLRSVKQILEESDIPGEDKEKMVEMINLAIKKIYEDHVQMSDLALKTLGATIDKARTSESYEPLWNCWFISCLFSSVKPPETVLEPDVYPGNCWSFQGSEGQVVINLPEKIHPVAVTVQHISKAIAPNENITTALKDFVVYGLDDETDEETLMGTFMYDIDKEIIQTFQLKNHLSKEFLYIKFKVQSNWGNPEFTCIYRLRIHGKMTSLSGPVNEGSG